MGRNYRVQIEKLASLETFDPPAFIADDKATQECCDFVLSLAVVFNDIKGLLLAETLLLVEAPEDKQTPTRELGAFGGLHVHFFRVLLGVLRELLNLVKAEKPTLSHPLFRSVIKKLPKSTRTAWDKIVVASTADTSADADVRFLVIARNTVAYHYGRKAIGIGYRRAFRSGDEAPFLSRGSSVSATRFYFADRAAQSYLQHILGENLLEQYFLKQPKLISDIAAALVLIVNKFVEARGFGWHGPAG